MGIFEDRAARTPSRRAAEWMGVGIGGAFILASSRPDVLGLLLAAAAFLMCALLAQRSLRRGDIERQ